MKIERPWGSSHLTVDGEGPVLLLLHPLAMSGEIWQPAVERLRDRFRVVTLDARGHGESVWDGTPFSVEDLAADAAVALEEVGDDPAHVLGMSMGGCSAIALAVRRPELVGRLTLVDTTADYGPEKGPTWEQRAENAVGKARAEQLPFQGDRWFSPSFLADNPAEVSRVSQIFLGTDSNAHAAACRALGAYDDSARLGDITAPTLVLVGDEDYATPPAMAEALHAGIAGSMLQVLEETRHLSLIQNLGAWDLVVDHLAG